MMTKSRTIHQVIATAQPSGNRRIPLPGHAVFLLLVMLITGCASVPTDYPRTQSTALTNHLDTGTGQFFEEAAVKHPGESGFAIIRRGRPAFTARIAFTKLAEQTLDLQYYIWEEDETGWILAEHVIKAADRGVWVRILVV